MATTNYGLEEINKATDVLSPDPINRNMVKIDTQMKANEQAVQTVAEQVATIDVTTDVEEVVNRRVNSDRTKTLNTIIGEIKDAIVLAINTARDNIKSHVTSEHTNTKSTLNTAITSARDSVNTNVDAEHVSTRKTVTDARDNINNNVNAKIADLKQHVSSKKSSLASAITGKGINTPSNASFDTMSGNIGKIVVKPSVYPSFDLMFSKLSSTSLIDAYCESMSRFADRTESLSTSGKPVIGKGYAIISSGYAGGYYVDYRSGDNWSIIKGSATDSYASSSKSCTLYRFDS